MVFLKAAVTSLHEKSEKCILMNYKYKIDGNWFKTRELMALSRYASPQKVMNNSLFSNDK